MSSEHDIQAGQVETMVAADGLRPGRTEVSVVPAGSDKSEPSRGRKRLGMVLDLTSASSPRDIACRPPVRPDREALAALMLDAYRDTVDYEGESLDDALREVDRTLSSSYGRFLPDCSFVLDGEGDISSASLVILLNEGKPDETPLLAFAMTRKCDQRRGLASALILHSAASLSQLGYSRLSLVVTADNVPARRLYERLGFEPAQQVMMESNVAKLPSDAKARR